MQDIFGKLSDNTGHTFSSIFFLNLGQSQRDPEAACETPRPQHVSIDQISDSYLK